MAPSIKSFETPKDVANAFASRLIDLLNQSKANGTTATVCLSGGSTPKLLFKTLAQNHADTDWSPADYQQQIEAVVAKDPAGIPAFDLMVLGMGDDGHTASIFPHEMELLASQKICDVATHPVSGQKRVTVTGQVISASQEICFLITGANKADVLAQILNDQPGSEQYPTRHFSDLPATTFWLDSATGA